MSAIAIAHPHRSHATVGQAGPVRLTRRGRLVVFVCCLALACLGLFALAGTAIGSGEAGEPVPAAVVTVQPGDTLWSIAQEVSPEEDPRDVIERIDDVNALNGSLQVGQKLAIPVEP